MSAARPDTDLIEAPDRRFTLTPPVEQWRRISEDALATIEGSIMWKSIAVAGLASVISLGLAGEALAHAHLKGATPPVNGSVTVPPTEIDLDFSEGVNLKFSGIDVSGPGGPVALGTATLMAGDDTMLTVPVTGTLGAGAYTVSWHALSTDGHKTHGTYKFTVKP
jgi:methionine-rich copper-binding protein CopC